MKKRSLLLCAILLAASGVISAQAPGGASAPVPAAPTSGFRADFLAQLDDVSKKILDLAGAVPAEKYSWRPEKGVRSVSEVYMHIVVANYFLPSFMGVQPPAGIDRSTETGVTDKAKVVAMLRQSFDHVRTVVLKTPDADLDKKVKVFGGSEMSERALIMVIGNHMHEHLGQSIAYARSNGVTPPWSEAAQPPAPPRK
jgi:uncharacterized damage-inducible protein DinB